MPRKPGDEHQYGRYDKRYLYGRSDADIEREPHLVFRREPSGDKQIGYRANQRKYDYSEKYRG